MDFPTDIYRPFFTPTPFFPWPYQYDDVDFFPDIEEKDLEGLGITNGTERAQLLAAMRDLRSSDA